MPAPTYVGDNIGAAINAFSIAWPAGHATNDIALLVIETGGEGTTLTPPSGWTAIASTPVIDIADATGSKLHCWWRRATSSTEASVSIGDSGDHQVALITVYRGCITTGDPFDVTTTGNKTAASTTATVPAVTTTVGQTLIAGIIGRPNDSSSTTEYSGYTNANLTSITERREYGAQSGHGGGMVVFTGIKSTAGNTGTTSVTKVTSTTDTYIVVALRPPPLILTADKGTFTLTGQAANLVHNARLTADKGAYALTGNAATLSKGGTPLNAYTLTAAAGSFTETGRDANLTRTRSLAADKGTVTLNGQPAGTRATRYLAADFTKYFLPERNLLKWSEEINSNAWTKIRCSVTPNATTSPDGSPTGEKIVEDTSNSTHILQLQNSAPAHTAGTIYTYSWYFKAGERTLLSIAFGSDLGTFNDQAFYVDLVSGAISNVSPTGFVSAPVAVNANNGWYRVSATVTANSSTLPVVRGRPVVSGSISYLGDGVSGYYVWGAQLEPASAATTYDPTGPVAAAITVTRVTRRLVADPGAFTLTGRDVGLVYASSKKIVADAGAFTLTGQPAALRKTELLIGAAGSFALTGNAAALVRGARLTAAAGSFAEAGNAATLRVTRRLFSAAGTFTLSGQSAGFQGQRYLPLAPGSFALTGNAATLRVTRSLAAAAGSIALTGNDAALVKTAARAITAQPGAFTLAGQPAALRWTHSLTAAAGSLTLTGQAATLRRAARLTAATGAFTAAGQAAALSPARRLTAAAGAFTATAQPATLRRGATLAASAGAATVNGATATLRRAVRLAAAPGAFIVSGQSAGFLGQRYMPLNPGAFALAGQLADLRFNRRLQGGSATFLATGPPVYLRPAYTRRRIVIF